MKFDEIGDWSETKLDIVKRYAQVYSKILASQPKLTHYYIDGFAGPGQMRSRRSGDTVAGSPINALQVEPPFNRYFLIDIKGKHIKALRAAVGSRSDVELFKGDCNDILVNKVLPQVRYDEYKRAFCLLDPDGLHLNWQVMELAGKLRTIDLLLNFPIMDANMNALWTNTKGVDSEQAARMTAFWGDDSWKEVAYTPETDLFGEVHMRKQSNNAIVSAFKKRLHEVAGFKHVAEPIPMRNSRNAIVYYLFFASQVAVALKVASSIFKRRRTRIVA